MAHSKPALSTIAALAQISPQLLARTGDSAAPADGWLPLSGDPYRPQADDHAPGRSAGRTVDREAGVDSPRQLVIALDGDARIVRVDRLAEAWGCGSVDAAPGQSLAAFLAPLAGGSTQAWNIDWAEFSERLRAREALEWEIDRRPQGRALRLSLRPLADDTTDSQGAATCCAVLVIDDVTEFKSTVDMQQRYAATLETSIQSETALLWQMNERLECELRAQRRAKLALLFAEQRYIALVESTLAGICRLEDRRITFCNRRFGDILGCSKSDLLGQDVLDLVHPEDHALFLDRFASLSQSTRVEAPVTIRATGTAGRCVWLNLVVSAGDSQEAGGVLLHVVDVTSEKDVELSLRASEKQLHTLSCQLIESQEQERKRIARELHDGIGQTMGAIKYKIEGMLANGGEGCLQPDALKLREIVDQIRDAIDESRKIAMDLRPSILDDLGVSLTIEWYCEEFSNTYSGIKISKRVAVDESAISEDRQLVIYRIIQEAMNNVAKHSQAAALEVELTDGEDVIWLQVRDDGQGFEPARLADANCARGLGLRSMQERAELTGGVFSVQSLPGEGTTIRVLWPKTAQSISRAGHAGWHRR